MQRYNERLDSNQRSVLNTLYQEVLRHACFEPATQRIFPSGSTSHSHPFGIFCSRIGAATHLARWLLGALDRRTTVRHCVSAVFVSPRRYSYAEAGCRVAATFLRATAASAIRRDCGE